MKNWLNNYFGFTKREYNGLLALMTMLLLTVMFPYVYAICNRNAEQISGNELAQLQKLTVVEAHEREYSVRKMAGPKPIATKALFIFDPNTIGATDWQKLGLSIKQADAILNYIKKGGQFRKPEDVQKMYTITPQKYQELLPYIKIENVATSKFQKDVYTNKLPYPKKEAIAVEINSADTLQLDEIKGIGAAFARRIVKYRERLGGFYQIEQLMEVYGLDSAKFNEIKNQVRVDEQNIVKIEINTATFDELKNHPYLKYKQINAILQYRNQHGRFNSIADLKKVVILTPENIQHLAPYLTFK